jgi:hypothetical protein
MVWYYGSSRRNKITFPRQNPPQKSFRFDRSSRRISTVEIESLLTVVVEKLKVVHNRKLHKIHSPYTFVNVNE